MALHGKEVNGRIILTDTQNKYRAVRTSALGRTFASRKEAEYCSGLFHLQVAGEISNLRFQVPYTLTVNGLDICKYIADAVYIDKADGKEHVIDVKGFRSKEYRLKKKLMFACLGITIEEV